MAEDEGCRIVSVDEVPTDTTFLFRVRDVESDEEREAILIRVAAGDETGEIACWLNYCQHFTHIKLDKGSGAQMRNGEVVCANHGAYFEADSGLCTHGPCEGAVLQEVEVTVSDGAVHLTDPAYEFVAVGPGEQDDLDRASKSNFEF